MIRNKKFNTSPMIVHAPGDIDFNFHWHKIKDAPPKKSSVECNCVPRLEIITWNSSENSTVKKNGCFEASLQIFGHSCNSLESQTWSSNREKIRLSVDFLNHSTADFILGVDSSDAIVVAPLNSIVSQFLEIDCDLLFNAEIRFSPPRGLNEIKSYENSLPTAPYFLNAGAWIGKKNFCLHFFQKALDISESYFEFLHSEQVCIKKAYKNMYPKVKIDDKCLIFQNLNLQEPTDIIICEAEWF